MATLNIPYSFINATQIVASEMNSNFTAVKSFVESLAAGTNIDSGVITSDKLATATIQLLTPTGTIVSYAGSSASVPTGWLLCDGTAVSQTTYAALYAVVGSTYNTSGGQAAPSAGTFRVPLLTGRVPVGRNASDAAFDVLGETGGAKDSIQSHFHTADGSLAAAGAGGHNHGGVTGSAGAHSHTYTVDGEYVPLGYQVAVYKEGAAATYSTSGVGDHSHSIPSVGDHTHDVTGNTSTVGVTDGNLQPYIVVNYLIKI